MEKALVYELGQAIPTIKDEIYPTNAPEDTNKPYLVYYRHRTEITKTLEGHPGQRKISFIISVMSKNYGEMKSLNDQALALFLGLPFKKIGTKKEIFVEDITINNVTEAWENALGVHRGIIDFSITIS